MFYRAKNGELSIDDTSAYYISFGKGNKNLIIIPGVGDGLKLVKGLAIPFSIMYKIFCSDYRVYVFSRRNNLPKGFSTEDMANDIINHMDKLNIANADVIGVSQGGMIAQYLAINAPEKVNKLVLTVTVPKTNEILEDSIKAWLEMAKSKDYKGIMVDTAERSYTGKYLEKQRRLYKLLGLFGKNATYDRFINEAESCLKHNTLKKLNNIKNPTLVIGARQDKVLGIVGSEELAKGIPNSELFIYDEYSHGVYEQAKDFNQRVLEYLKKERKVCHKL